MSIFCKRGQTGRGDRGLWDLCCIWERQEGIQQAVVQALPQWARTSREQAASDRPGLLVLSPKAAQEGVDSVSAPIILFPGDRLQAIGQLQADSAVSYGLGAKDTLTVSSCARDGICVALQREIVTLQGHVVEQQEFPASLEPGEDIQRRLAVVGTLLLLGLPPAQLF